ncbi:MAG: hypothetical protein H7325_08475 [Pedobacter sp.]|nr:hypothetical protein [Pedobacter sp.]
MLNGNLKYLPRPLKADSVSSKTFISGVFIQFQGLNDDDANGEGGEFSISRAKIFRDFNIAYGATLSSGRMTYKTFDKMGKSLNYEKNSFGTLLLQSSIQWTFVEENIEYRYLSLDLGYSKEFGDYKNVRNRLAGNEYYTVATNTGIFSAGLSTEIALRRNNFSGALRVGLGRNFGTINYIKGLEITKQSQIIANVSLYTKYRAVFAVLDFGSQNSRVGLGYSF